MVEDRDAGNNGVGGRFTEGVGRCGFVLAFGMDTRELHDRPKVNAYGRLNARLE
jgi:hypothetical protein